MSTDPLTTAEDYARRMYFAAIARLSERVAASAFPFLKDYQVDLAGLRPDAWCGVEGSPLHRLALVTSFDVPELVELFTVALVDEDARFGAVFEAATGHPRPTLGLLHAWWPSSRGVLRRMRELGLLVTVPGSVSTADECLRVPPLVWAAIRGEPPPGGGPVRHHAAADAVPLADLVLGPATRATVARLPAALASCSVDALVVRGPLSSGRHTLARSVAATTGLGTLELEPAADDSTWASAGVVATLLGAAPLVQVTPEPGEHRVLPPLPGSGAPLLVVTGRWGAVTGPGLQRPVTVDLGIPGPEERERHWEAVLGTGGQVAELAGRYRMTGGTIRRAARSAQAAARLDGRTDATPGDVAPAVREIQRAHFDTLANRVDTPDAWSAVAVAPDTMRDLALAETRCRHRESLDGGAVRGSAGGAGVRLLFRGPSGTGKTLAARTLAGVLGLDLYAVDLAGVVDKYLGVTEKNLDRLFSRAEENGAALLLDEGDALMTQRTAVQSSNDRYANLETNFLLQRLESFDGILVVTTNAGKRIDSAFERRMDAVVDFGPPGEVERWWLWRLHLPAEHEVVHDVVDDLAVHCPMTGAEIRKTTLHAALLALEEGSPLREEHLLAATHRELEKAGRSCPLPREAGRG